VLAGTLTIPSIRSTLSGKAFSKAALIAAPALPAPITKILGARLTAARNPTRGFAIAWGISLSGRTASTAACQIAKACSRSGEDGGGGFCGFINNWNFELFSGDSQKRRYSSGR
jgi:hypothetical protein